MISARLRIQLSGTCDTRCSSSAPAHCHMQLEGSCARAHAGIGLGRMADATWTICSRHLGSMAFGSLIIAICQLIRLVLNAIGTCSRVLRAHPRDVHAALYTPARELGVEPSPGLLHLPCDDVQPASSPYKGSPALLFACCWSAVARSAPLPSLLLFCSPPHLLTARHADHATKETQVKNFLVKLAMKCAQ